MKKPVPSPSPGSSARRRGRRMVEYGLLAIGAVVFLDGLVGEKGLLETIKKRSEYRALEDSIAAVRAENERLREEAARLRNDAQAIEELARRELGLIRPGEHLFIIKDVPAPGESEPTEPK